ncbi:hypothetical protein ACFSQD_08620 [Flavihumibacter stibioxidans]|uniref:Uncharacterized protein n=1 Tax=Flavihumibacter stibioxidans TaxID=1834163 RepID=A0ABR7M6X9_9BACT|nr:hypothetical protein [Flavihumibacter stibioxidans]MBC6490371.1 hypothetical protein [Flavihumibacter stibioxidans]
MKKVSFLILLVIVLCSPAEAQIQNDQQTAVTPELTASFNAAMRLSVMMDTSLSKSDYLLKSKNQKTAAWVMLGGGTALFIAGVLIGNDTDEGEWFGDNLEKGIIVAGVGAGLALGSIPFFISSAMNKRRAAGLSIIHQKIMVPDQKSFKVARQPALSLTVRL